MIPQSLQESLRAGKVIPFVGAGVSMAVRRKVDGQPLFPSWRDLLLGAADQLEQENKKPNADLVRAYLGLPTPKYVEAAGHARDSLGATWVEYLKQRLDPESREVDPESLALARAVWDLGNKLVVTTNYDRALTWACPEPLRDDLGQWDIQASAEQARFLREGIPDKPTVWHLHGQIRNATDLILTPDGYHRLYPEGSDLEQRFKAAQATLRHTLASRSLLFVGFSFQDAHLGITLDEVQKLFEGTSSKHYALVHDSDTSLLRSRDLPVELITFQDFGEPLLQLMHQLAGVGRGAGTAEGNLAALTPPLSATFVDTTINTVVHSEIAPYSPRNRPFFVPFRPKRDRVIGREKALEDVRRQLTQGKPTAIGQTASFEGIGGLGKTQLAVEYAWRYGDTYPNGVIWVNADQDIDAQLTRLAVEAKWVAHESEHKIKLDIAKYRLRSYSDCLIIFDNLEDFAAIKPYLPDPGAQPHLLATSRTEQPMFTSVDLHLLDEAQSLGLLIQEAERSPEEPDEQEAATKIVESLGRLPLALEMAGAYLRHRNLLTWRQYLGMLESNLRAALRPNLLASFTQHEQDLFATLKIHEEILQDEPLLGDVLKVLTWSSPRSIGLSLLSALLRTDEVLLTSALALGQKLRILEREEGKDRYSLHRLISRVRREEVPLEQQKDWVEELCARMGDWFEARRRNFADLPTLETEIDHLQTWQEHAVRLSSQHISRLIWLEAYPAYHRGLYHEAQSRVLDAITHFRTGENPRLESWLWNDLGTTEGALGNYQSDLEYQQRALKIRLETFGEQDPDTARSLDSVGAIYLRIGEHQKALEFTLKALEIRKNLLGEQHPDTARSLDSVGTVYLKLEDSQKALDFTLKALEIRKRLLGDQHPDTARSLDIVGSAYLSVNEVQKALELTLQALEIRRKLLGEQHPVVADSLTNMGNVYYNLGRPQEALEFALRALDIVNSVLGEQHPDTATCLENVSRVHFELRDYKAALNFRLKALEIIKITFGELHSRTASIIDEIGLSYSSLRENQKALENHQNALKIRMAVLGEHHPDVTKSLIRTTRGLLRLNRRPEAFALLEPYLQKLPADHPALPALEALRKQVLAKPLRPGFRQPALKKRKGRKQRKQ